jgi:hypothetical protein
MHASTFASVLFASLAAAQTQLPSTLQLNVLTTSGTQIGCLNGYGNFTADLIWCYPFRAFPITTETGYATLAAYSSCVTDEGTVNCYPQDGDTSTGAFTVRFTSS